MERAHAGIFAPAEANAPDESKPSPTLAEVTHAPTMARSTPLSSFRWQPVAIIAGYAVAGLLTLFLIGRGLLRWRRRRTRNSVWLLPEVEIKPRFGAPHCGQGGAWIRFG
jgi:hypothetical protein